MLDPKQAKIRQRRMLDALAAQKLDAVVVGLSHHVYYLSAFLPHWLHQAGFAMLADGRSCLIAASNRTEREVAADEVIPYDAAWHATLRQEQPADIAGKAIEWLRSHGAKRIGVDASPVASQLELQSDATFESIDSILWQLRRRKDPDELELMKTGIRCTEAMYAQAREIVEPGIQELEVFAQLHGVAVQTAGEPLSALLGNDYACGAGGGPPRKDRAAKAGEIYVLDLGPAYRGYFSDNCRAISVDRKPTDVQLKAQSDIIAALKIVESTAKPGVRCRDIYDAVDQQLNRSRGKGMTHHLGHGVGLQPHEYPHLNPRWDDVLIEGEIFTAEPGIYAPDLAGGIRIENDYLVTKDGVKNLLNSPMELDA